MDAQMEVVRVGNLVMGAVRNTCMQDLVTKLRWWWLMLGSALPFGSFLLQCKAVAVRYELSLCVHLSTILYVLHAHWNEKVRT